jgi:hypothetical protein
MRAAGRQDDKDKDHGNRDRGPADRTPIIGYLIGEGGAVVEHGPGWRNHLAGRIMPGGLQ